MSIGYNSAGVLKYDFAGGIKNAPRKSTAAHDAGTLVTISGGKFARCGDLTAADSANSVVNALQDVHGILLNDILADVVAGLTVNPSQGITSDASLGRDYWSGTQALGVGQFRVPTASISGTAAVDAEITWATATGWTVASAAGQIVVAKIEHIGSNQCTLRLCIPYRNV